MNVQALINPKIVKNTAIRIIYCVSIMLLLIATPVCAEPISMTPNPAVLHMGGEWGDVELTLNYADTTSTSYDFTLTGSNRTGSGWIAFRITNIGGGWDNTTIAVGTPLFGVSEYTGSILSSSVFDFFVNTSSDIWSLNLEINHVASWDYPTTRDGNFISVSASNITQGIEFEESSILSIPVPVDIKPASCPNPFLINSNGVLPVAVLGTATFDVNQVDIATIKLEGVPPVRSAYEDVATPFEPYTWNEDCLECTTEKQDGFEDLNLKFNIEDVIAVLGSVKDRDCLLLHLTGNLKEEFGGIPIVGEDKVFILFNNSYRKNLNRGDKAFIVEKP